MWRLLHIKLSIQTHTQNFQQYYPSNGCRSYWGIHFIRQKWKGHSLWWWLMRSSVSCYMLASDKTLGSSYTYASCWHQFNRLPMDVYILEIKKGIVRTEPIFCEICLKLNVFPKPFLSSACRIITELQEKSSYLFTLLLYWVLGDHIWCLKHVFFISVHKMLLMVIHCFITYGSHPFF